MFGRDVEPKGWDEGGQGQGQEGAGGDGPMRTRPVLEARVCGVDLAGRPVCLFSLWQVLFGSLISCRPRASKIRVANSRVWKRCWSLVRAHCCCRASEIQGHGFLAQRDFDSEAVQTRARRPRDWPHVIGHAGIYAADLSISHVQSMR